MIKLRVTDLDAWVRYVAPEREEFAVPHEQFLAYMKREGEETEAMRIGRAFHAALECFDLVDAMEAEVEEVTVGDYTFRFDADCEIRLPNFRESEIEKVYDTPSGAVLLRGRVDGRTANTITDYKLTLGQFDAERYAGSMQWRAYLDMTGARRFEYEVFQGKAKGENITVYDHHRFTQWAYPAMGADVQRRVAELAEYVVAHVPELIIEPLVEA